MTRDPASERQVRAAEPDASTWLSANAGSGKTRVLTDRVARLLLAGVPPQRILCLTYTKAAASEMQNRLFRTLGAWAMQPDAGLRSSLVALGEDALPDLSAARRLFARAIETPGGLRIQTIHSFCATLLRRFPLEADVSPQFTEMDDRAARLMRDEIAEELSDTLAPAVMADLARAYTGEDFGALLQQVAGNRGRFDPPLSEAEVRAAFGVPRAEDMACILGDTFLGDEALWVPRILPAMRSGLATDFDLANLLDAQDWTNPDAGTLAVLEDALLTKGGAAQPFSAKIAALPTKNTRPKLGDDLPRFHALMTRVEDARPRRIALQAATRTATLHRFAAHFLPVYAARKAARGWLDFDDLITRAKALLTDPSVAAWVLFRLDGGIDHILVDEAQDTSPDQWRVIELLAAEFTAGIGTRPGGRTLFVVGDKKQSIYSFQGADVAAFDAKHRAF
ncbi:MAG: UvrD-helicase domain-containing protein, partial [Paracoccaceae bacterium]